MQWQPCATVLVLAPTLLAAEPAGGGEWPMWGGSPDRNMVSPTEAPMPADFDPGQLGRDRLTIEPDTTRNVRWVARLGSQTYGNPTVAQGRVFVGTNNEHREDPRFPGDYSLVRAFDAKSGEPHWTFTVPKLGRGPVMDFAGVGICSSPAVDGDRVYVVTTRCEVVCLDIDGMHSGNRGPFTREAEYMAGFHQEGPPVELRPHDGDIVWRFDMAEQLGVRPWNVTAGSVLVVGDLVYAATSNGADPERGEVPNPDAPALIALDKHTGALVAREDSGIGRSLLDGAWSSPAYGEVDGRGILLYGCGGGYLWAFDARPVAGGDREAESEAQKGEEVSRLADPSEQPGTLRLLWRVDVNPEHFRRDERDEPVPYFRGRSGPSVIVGTPVFHEGRVYAALGQDPELGPGEGNFVCVDAKTGRVLWSYDELELSLSTPAVHDGLVYMADHSGFIHCLDAETGRQVWVHDTLSPIWGSTLVADGKVYVGTDGGDLVILAAGRQRNLLETVHFQAPINNTPVAADGVLYVATNSNLFAIAAPTE